MPRIYKTRRTSAKDSQPKTEKVHKVLADIGLGSRRQIEEWVAQGRVKINRRLATIGDRVSERDKLYLNGKLINRDQYDQNSKRVIIYHKASGVICARRDPRRRKTVFHDLPKLRQGRWINVGRLDINTSGLLLFTNDGELANRLMHPSYEVEREYAVRVLGDVSNEAIQKLKHGIELVDGLAKFDQVNDAGGEGANHWYHVILKEGRKREVRRLWEAVGCQVSRLIRIRYAFLTLPRDLRPGNYKSLNPAELKRLQKLVGLSI